MYRLENVEMFISEGGAGYKLDSFVRAGILVRAKQRADKKGVISAGNTKFIMADEKIQEIFENDLGTNIDQLEIQAKLVKTTQ